MASIKPEDYLKNAVYFFDRPMKPIYTPKGPNKNVFIELHPSYFVSNFIITYLKYNLFKDFL